MRFFDFYDQTRIVPPTQRFRRRDVNGAFSFRARDGNGEVPFARCAVDVCVSGNKKSFPDGGTESLNHGRVRLRLGERVFIKIGRFDRTEYDHDHRTNEGDEEKKNCKAADRYKPFPVSCPPVALGSGWDRRGCRLHEAFLADSGQILQPSSLRSKLDL